MDVAASRLSSESNEIAALAITANHSSAMTFSVQFFQFYMGFSLEAKVTLIITPVSVLSLTPSNPK